ncbi:uncharacterized protein NPIL_16941 [Nephila pilipes]|uniref:Uncharacterized protein n=1 Tax=Nephila pilipes TaxID=299642 RepID=A0A8X6TN63_NEPPI|nr:uncharacterized protein NPIL_16941 [Nephila pilipes]
MGSVHIYAPLDLLNDGFLQRASQEKLISLETHVPVECAHIERHCDCACSCPSQLVVQGKSIIVPRDQQVVNAFPCYALPKECTSEEMVTVVTWLTRHKFWTFANTLENGSLVRYLTPQRIFRLQPHPSCDQCEQHLLEGEPVFCLKNIVLSSQNKGPTVESVL